MGRTPDRYPGIREESAILLDDNASAPTDPHTIARVNGELRVVDAVGAYNPRSGGPHETTHRNGGSDPLAIQNLAASAIAERILKTDGLGGLVLIGAPGEFFGSQLQWATSLGLSTTSSTSPVLKLRLTTTDLPLGTYVVITNMILSGSSASSIVIGRLFHNSTEEIGRITVKPGVADGEIALSPHGVFENVSGVHTLDLEFWRDASGSGTVSARAARLTLWRMQ